MNNKHHLWSGRFTDTPDPDVFQWQASFAFDRRLFEHDVEGSIAWTEALARAGVLSSTDATKIKDGLLDILKRGQQDPSFVDGPDEDVHAFVERQLIDRIGDVGRRLHTGRSRNEQISLDLRLYLRQRLPIAKASAIELIQTLADQAQVAGAMIMPAYTHLRRAQPTLVAHFFLAHATALRRDCERLDLARNETNAMPLGSGAVAGTNYAVDTQALAEQLGFTRVVENSLDASSDRDFVSSTLHAYSLLMVHLSRLAEDLIIFTGEEFGFFELADSVATGSSLMPQKKNPDPLELVRGKTGRVIGRLTAFLTTIKGLPSGYNKDLQEDKEALFDAENSVIGSLKASTTVVGSLKIISGKSEIAATGLLLATDVADYLVGQGMPFRSAHEIVGGIVRDLVARGQDFKSLTLADWKKYHESFGADVIDRITVQGSVDSKQTPQSTNPNAVREALANLNSWTKAHKDSK